MDPPADREDGYGNEEVSLYCHYPESEFEYAKSKCMAFLTCVATMAAQAQESAAESEDRNFIEVFVGITQLVLN
jgi:hypothetical protein